MRKLGKVARPRTAVADIVPDSVPPPGLSPITTVTNPVNVVSRFPPASSPRSCTYGSPMMPPAISSCGRVWKSRWDAGPIRTSNGTLSTPGSPAADAISDNDRTQSRERGVQVPARILPPELHVRIADDAARDLVVRARLEVEVGRRPYPHDEI